MASSKILFDLKAIQKVKIVAVVDIASKELYSEILTTYDSMFRQQLHQNIGKMVQRILFGVPAKEVRTVVNAQASGASKVCAKSMNGKNRTNNSVINTNLTLDRNYGADVPLPS